MTEDAGLVDSLPCIAADIRHLAIPVSELRLLPGNPHQGDVEAVAKSYAQFGQRKPITGQRDQRDGSIYVTAGNTQLKAARRLNWSHIAIIVFEDDEKTAVAWALADNRTAELGVNDEELLATMLKNIEDDIDLLDASGYDLLDYEELLEEEIEQNISDYSEEDSGIDEDDAVEDEEDDKGPRKPGKPVIQYAIIFDDEEQQERWYKFMRWLRRTKSEYPSIASRLDAFLLDLLPEE